jgi:hypothetical protein
MEYAMDFKTFFICVFFSLLLMALFVFINIPYYKVTHGEKAMRIALRAIMLNSAAIVIGWSPVVFLWPQFSYKFLLPFVCALGALGCVGSRFIYHEIIPESLAQSLIEIVERKAKEKDEG